MNNNTRVTERIYRQSYSFYVNVEIQGDHSHNTVRNVEYDLVCSELNTLHLDKLIPGKPDVLRTNIIPSWTTLTSDGKTSNLFVEVTMDVSNQHTLLCEHEIVNGIHYPKNTDPELVKVLDTVRVNNERVTIRFGVNGVDYQYDKQSGTFDVGIFPDKACRELIWENAYNRVQIENIVLLRCHGKTLWTHPSYLRIP